MKIKYNQTMKKIEKIGKGYYQSGYGRGFKKNPIIRLINGKAYAKDSTGGGFQTDIEGHVMVNQDKTYKSFYQVGLIWEHENFTNIK